MKLQTILASAALLLATAGSANAGELFVESRTQGDLTVNGDTSVLSSVNVGGTFFGEWSFTDVYGGVGYALSTREDLALNVGARTTAYVGKDVFVELELDTTYLTQADELTFEPSVRVRKYFSN